MSAAEKDLWSSIISEFEILSLNLKHRVHS